MRTRFRYRSTRLHASWKVIPRQDRRWLNWDGSEPDGFRNAFRVTEESITQFKKRYVSLLSIARTTNSASWALQRLCTRVQPPGAGRKAAGHEEQPGVHSRGAEARDAPLGIGQKADVAITLASFAVLISNYGWYIEVKFSSTAWRARIALSSSSPSFSAQPAASRIPCSTSIGRNSGSGVEVAEGSQQSQADGHIRLGHRDGGKIGLTHCPERSSLPGLPRARVNGSSSSDRLRDAGLCHFLFHFSEDSLAERSLLVFAWHDTIIMSCSES